MRRLLLLVLLLASCSASTGPVTVTRIIDGDTIDVRLTTGKIARVRIVGIDTPETVDPRKPVQCFGKEASQHMKALVEEKEVQLQTKPDEDKDKYGRLLRYVQLGGNDIGASMIRDGYAFSYKWFPHPRMELYNGLEKAARERGSGLWGAACSAELLKKRK